VGHASSATKERVRLLELLIGLSGATDLGTGNLSRGEVTAAQGRDHETGEQATSASGARPDGPPCG
jgi:hypothetical protein